MSNYMRVIVLFDLPTKTKEERKEYTRFRKMLLYEGFDMMQFSVYSRLCNGHESVGRIVDKISRKLPQRGQIRVISITDKQYARMKLLLGDRTSNEKHVTIHQFSLF